MAFKRFFENELLKKPITNLWPLNKNFYDMSSVRGRKEYEDDLKSYFANKTDVGRRKIISEKTVSEPYEITCWRGCDPRSLKRDTIDVGPGFRIMHGRNAMEGILWFAHSLQQDDPFEFAKSYAGGILITYPLKAIKHVLVKTYDDGKVENTMPEELASQIQVNNESRYLAAGNAVYEVPEGWFFTWQVQKHLGCRNPIKVMNSMISKL